ncbi:MAG TPA: hypothetical protein VK809_04040, partial [Bacteroidia bacterium]|nr:hypothetical protein [Bacteroidia bacterium]
FGEEHDNLLSQLSEQAKPVEKKLNSEILNWKIFQDPTKKYDVVNIYKAGALTAFCVSDIVNGRTFITYLAIQPEADTRNVLFIIMNYLFHKNNSFWIFTWEPQNTEWRSQFSNVGFLKNPFPKGPLSYKIPVILRFEPVMLNDINMHEIENYDITPIFQD